MSLEKWKGVDMNWGERKLAALQKMFSAGAVIDTDESTQDYIAAMPFAANEAIQRILDARPVRKQQEIELEGNPEEQGIDLQDVAYDYKNSGPMEVYTMSDTGVPRKLYGCRVMAGRYLVVPPLAKATKVLLHYDATVPRIWPNTKDNFPLPVDEDAAALIPIYIAGELYKDDDNSISTTYMNEFEYGLQMLVPKDTGVISNAFTSESGW